MGKDTYRVVTRGADGEIRIRDYDNQEALLKRHTQIGVDDCSTDLGLRGLPVFRGLVGPMPEGKNVIRYESPEVFETLTKDWSAAKASRRRRSRTHPPHTLGISISDVDELYSIGSNIEPDVLEGIGKIITILTRRTGICLSFFVVFRPDSLASMALTRLG